MPADAASSCKHRKPIAISICTADVKHCLEVCTSRPSRWPRLQLQLWSPSRYSHHSPPPHHLQRPLQTRTQRPFRRIARRVCRAGEIRKSATLFALQHNRSDITAACTRNRNCHASSPAGVPSGTHPGPRRYRGQSLESPSPPADRKPVVSSSCRRATIPLTGCSIISTVSTAFPPLSLRLHSRHAANLRKLQHTPLNQVHQVRP